MEGSIFDKYQLHPRLIDFSIQSELDKYLQKAVAFGWLKSESSNWETTALGNQIYQLTDTEFQRAFYQQEQDWFGRKMEQINGSSERLQTEISRKPGLDHWRYKRLTNLDIRRKF